MSHEVARMSERKVLLDEYRDAARKLAEFAEGHRSLASAIAEEWRFEQEGPSEYALDLSRRTWISLERQLASVQEEYRRRILRRLDQLESGSI